MTRTTTTTTGPSAWPTGLDPLRDDAAAVLLAHWDAAGLFAPAERHALLQEIEPISVDTPGLVHWLGVNREAWESLDAPTRRLAMTRLRDRDAVWRVRDLETLANLLHAPARVARARISSLPAFVELVPADSDSDQKVWFTNEDDQRIANALGVPYRLTSHSPHGDVCFAGNVLLLPSSVPWTRDTALAAVASLCHAAIALRAWHGGLALVDPRDIHRISRHDTRAVARFLCLVKLLEEARIVREWRADWPEMAEITHAVWRAENAHAVWPIDVEDMPVHVLRTLLCAPVDDPRRRLDAAGHDWTGGTEEVRRLAATFLPRLEAGRWRPGDSAREAAAVFEHPDSFPRLMLALDRLHPLVEPDSYLERRPTKPAARRAKVLRECRRDLLETRFPGVLARFEDHFRTEGPGEQGWRIAREPVDGAAAELRDEWLWHELRGPLAATERRLMRRWWAAHHGAGRPPLLERWQEAALTQSDAPSEAASLARHALFDALAAADVTTAADEWCDGIVELVKARDWGRAARLLDRPVAEWATGFAQCIEEARGTTRACHAGSVRFKELEPDLVRINEFLSGRGPRLVLKPSPSGGYEAYTDGRSITLPAAIAITPRRRLNIWLYVRLLVHEIGHMKVGSFGFRFDTPAGRRIWERLRPRRDRYRDWRSRRLPDGMAKRPRVPHVVQLFEHFPHPGVLRFLHNVVEDVRVEAWICRDWPELGRIARVLHDWEEAAAVFPRFCNARSNFLRALIARSLALPTWARPHTRHRDLFARLAARLDAFRDTALHATVYDATTLAIDLAEMLEEGLSPEDAGHLAAQVPAAWRLRFEEVIEALPELEKGVPVAVDLETFDPNGPYARIEYPEGELRPLESGRPSYPEFDAWTGGPVANVVQIEERPWVPWTRRSGGDPPVPPPLVPLPAGGRARRLELTAECGEWDVDRLYDMVVAARAGTAGDDRVYRRWRRARGASRWVVSLVIDQTMSMESDRPGYGTHTPLARACSILGQIGRWFDEAGMDFGIFGGWDTGPRPSTLYVHKDYAEPFDPAALETIHADSFGGFRFGGIVRHLSARVSREFPGRRHLVVLLTDATCHYVVAATQERMREIDFTETCRRCEQRPNCIGEPPRHQLRSAESDAGVPTLLLPTFYAMGDFTHAMESCPGTECLFVVLDEGFTRALLDRVFGVQGWLLVTTDESQMALASRIRSILTRGM